MNRRHWLLAVTLALPLAACSLGRPVPQPTTYLVDPTGMDPTGEVTAVSRRPERLRMGHVSVAAAYAGSGLIYRLDEVRYAIDPYHAFAADPGAMLGNRMAEWLDRNGPFSAVAPPGSAQPAPYVLEATVEELYGDFRGGTVPAAVLSVQFALIDQASARPKVVYERTIGARVTLPKATPEALINGYGTALGQILAQVAADLAVRI